MTRKQALHKALEVLTDETAKAKVMEILDDMPFTGWSERTIFDTIDQFIIDNGRIPTTTDFKKKGLPPHPVIKLRFGINLKAFLQQYYPMNKLCDSKIYYGRTKEEWKEGFIFDYINNKPRSAEEHNSTRTAGTPSWQTIAGMHGVVKWLEWIAFCKLERYCVVDIRPRGKVSLSVSSSVDLERALT
jgi:hypothetical protein